MAEARQLMAQAEAVQRQMQRIDARISSLEQAMADTQQALGTARHLATSTGAHEVLLPIGAGVHVRATVDPAAQLVTPIGAGYSTAGGAAKIVEALEARAKGIAQSFDEANAEAAELAQAYAALSDELQGMPPN